MSEPTTISDQRTFTQQRRRCMDIVALERLSAWVAERARLCERALAAGAGD